MKTELPRSLGSFMHVICQARCHVGEGLLQSAASAWNPRNEEDTPMATVDHDRQGQAAHRHEYKSRTVVEFASGKAMHNQHS